MSRSEEHTSELQSLRHLVCRLLLEKKSDIGEPPRLFELTYQRRRETEGFGADVGGLDRMSVVLRPAVHCFFNDTATTEIYTLSLHDALPIWRGSRRPSRTRSPAISIRAAWRGNSRSEEHTSELQSLRHLVCRLLLEKKK